MHKAYQAGKVGYEEQTRVGTLTGENQKAEMGIVMDVDSIVHRIRTGEYDGFYPVIKKRCRNSDFVLLEICFTVQSVFHALFGDHFFAGWRGCKFDFSQKLERHWLIDDLLNKNSMLFQVYDARNPYQK